MIKDVNKRDFLNQTQLHFLCDNFKHPNKNYIKIRDILELGADVNAQSNFGTPLIYASRSGSERIVKLLLNHCADINAVDHEGRNALHHASFNQCIATVKVLLNAGAEVNACDFKGRTAIHHAIYMCASQSLLRYLLNWGADVNAQDNDGNTALHLAVQDCAINLVEVLLEFDIDTEATNELGFTALDYCTCPKIADLISSHISEKQKQRIFEAIAIDEINLSSRKRKM